MVPSGTARLWCWDTGGMGTPLVLLHPATGSGRIWRYQQAAFVRAGRRVIGYSRRGAAGSDAGMPGDPTSATDDLRAVLNHCGVGRCHLLGTAGGAFTAVDFALASPGSIAGLVLANSLLGVTGGELDAMLRDLQLPALQKLPVEVRELSPGYRVANPTGVAAWLAYTRGAAAVSRPAGSVPAPGGPPTSGSGPTLESLRAIKAPTLLIAGDADLLAPPPLMAVFPRYLRDSRTVRLPACGHSGYWEMPGMFNAAVLSFVGKVA